MLYEVITKITDSQLLESDKAEEIVNYEQIFINKRKNSIRKKLNSYNFV